MAVVDVNGAEIACCFVVFRGLIHRLLLMTWWNGQTWAEPG
jgi:hypothetical protein